MILVIDNYDSFTYNLVQYLGELKAVMKVYRNDKISVSDIKRFNPERIVISPGPGRPSGAGVSIDVIKQCSTTIPTLGVCLGHQCIGEAFGGKIIYAKKLMHGKTSRITHNNQGLFANIKNPFEATRYHSLVIDPVTKPAELDVTATSDDDEIMGIQHRQLPLWGVQFHPESILTEVGKEILQNFLSAT